MDESFDGEGLPLTEFDRIVEAHRRIALDVAVTRTQDGEKAYIYDGQAYTGTPAEVSYAIMRRQLGDLWHTDFSIRTIRFEPARMGRRRSSYEGQIVIVLDTKPEPDSN